MEIWKAIPGFEGGYEVSSLGRVRSITRLVLCRGGARRSVKGQMLKPQKHSSDYLQVGLCGKTYLVHSLVMLAFVGECPCGKECAHNNGKKVDNRLTNLRYATVAENAADRIRHGTSGKGAGNSRAKLTPQLVERIRKSGEPRSLLAKIAGVSVNHIDRVRAVARW